MKKNVLITGASSGIGYEFAARFAKEGYNIIAVARNKQKLDELKRQLEKTYGITVWIYAKDLSNQNEVHDLYETLKNEQLDVHILVNNAGFGLYGEFVETELQEELNMIDLNIKTLTHLTKCVVLDMVKRNEGKILNVASTAAFQPGPFMAVYYATKAYVLSFSEALSNELRHTNVTVSALCPGPTATGFADRANLQQSKLFKSGVMDVKQVVEAGYRGVMNNKTVIIPGLANKLLAFSVRFMPRKFVTNIVRKVQDRVR
ncbi:SDR family NAD(P)-dependent oxidoreductase [Anoxybacteroides amylolyticum]|uniref:Short chain dehydrogenase family protein n=1 Tax=Anoxybacteroides amylolyticum TaxID=294699 RepID=A0A167TBJ8_9BACL|nr:SDR family oxidoreductase [Anoxybacillus amylolyticus]ANB59910.1 short chain dehydrogenase family protein [Anoxybacillus amylolyticus]